METLILWCLGTLGSAFLGSYLAAYLKKKGENLATHEDIAKLVEQVRAVTTTTKEIEAKISNDVWRRQKHWELKRDALFDAAKQVRAIEDALFDLASSFYLIKATNQVAQAKEASEASKKWSEVAGQFEDAWLLVSLVCGKELSSAYAQFRGLMHELAEKVATDLQAYDSSRIQRGQSSIEIMKAIRNELSLLTAE